MAISRLCSIPDCGKPAKARGLCEAHYRRLLRHGDPLAGRTPDGEPLEFLNNMVLGYTGNGCIDWPYSRGEGGYPLLRHNGRMVRASRLVCEHVHGSPPSPKHDAAHLCGRGHKGCVTPRHLAWKLPVDNHADKFYHGTIANGERHGKSKITSLQAKTIKSLLLNTDLTQQQIADQLGTTRRIVSCIKNGATWRHVQISAS